MANSTSKVIVFMFIAFGFVYSLQSVDDGEGNVTNSKTVRNAKVAHIGDKSKEKCKEYGKYVYEKPSEANSSSEDCEFVDYHPRTDPNAKPKEFPHMAAIGYDGPNKEKLWGCSGSLISDQFVLTAAHCINNSEFGTAKYVRLGDLVLNSNDDDAKPQEFKIAEIFAHPEYILPSVYNDIALIKIDKVANLNQYVRPACIDTTTSYGHVAIMTSTWGKTNNSSEYEPNLLMTDLKQYSYAECNNYYKNPPPAMMRNGISAETHVCAGARMHSDACVVGTGGPLQIFNKNVFCTYTIVGVKSFGRACNGSDVPDVFTKVSPYLEWIEEIVWS